MSYEKIYCPQSQWASTAEKYGFFLPQELKEKGRCGTTDKETGEDAEYEITNKDGVLKLRLHSYRTSGELKTVYLIDDSQAVGKKKPKRTKSASDGTDADSDEQAKEREAEEKRLAELHDKYCAYEPATDDNAYLRRKGVPCVPGLKQDGQALIVPFFDYKGEVTGLQRIEPDGAKRFFAGSRRGVFTIQGLADTPDQPILVCEGLATGISLWYSTFATVVVAGCADNMKAGAGYTKEHFPGWPVECCADNDNSGGENVGLNAAKQAAMAHGCYVAVPPAADGEKMDFNDLHRKFGREKVAEVVADALKQGAVKIPQNFKLTNNGLFVEITKGKESYTEQISKSPLKVEALARPYHQGNTSWEFLVRWKNPDGEWQSTMIPNNSTASDLRILSDRIGTSYIANWNKYRSYIYEYLVGTETNRRIELVDKGGWVDDLYVTPDRCFGIPKENEVQLSSQAKMVQFSYKGSLDDFKELTHLAQGNYIFVTALCAACAAPLLGLASQESGGLHFVGRSSSGKTTALFMASSVWHKPIPMMSWNTTGNALEEDACNYHDNLMVVDEISQASSKDLYKSLYSMANGSGKSRCVSTKTGVEKANPRQWRISYLSTGEEDVDQKLRRDGFIPLAGQEVRLASIPLEDHIHNLHGYKTEDELFNAVRIKSMNAYGVAGVRLLEYLTAYVVPLREALGREKDSVVAMYQAKLCKPYETDGKKVDSQVSRVAKRFALCIIGGCLASAWGIIDISQDEIVQSVTKAFASWIDYRGGTQSAETRSVVEGTRALLKKYADKFIVDAPEEPSHMREMGDARDVALKKSITAPIGGIAGYIVPFYTRKAGHYVDRDFFRNTLCRDLNKSEQVVKHILEAEGILKRDDKDNRYTVRFTPHWLYGCYTNGKPHRDRYYRLYYPEMVSFSDPEPDPALEPKSESEHSTSE